MSCNSLTTTPVPPSNAAHYVLVAWEKSKQEEGEDE
jgi:hypothetical protein